jgi:hypothetical protein
MGALQKAIGVAGANEPIHEICFTLEDSGEDENVEAMALKLERSMEMYLQSRPRTRRATSQAEKIKEIMRKWFRASHPFSKIFLTVAKEGSSVYTPIKRLLTI